MRDGLGEIYLPVAKPAGALIADGRQVADTLQCCHCSAHWTPVKGSGIRRGFCLRCMAPVCGHPSCDPCIPFLEKLQKANR